MRGEFAKLCLETIKNDSKSVVMVGDISHFLLRETEQKHLIDFTTSVFVNNRWLECKVVCQSRV